MTVALLSARLPRPVLAAMLLLAGCSTTPQPGPGHLRAVQNELDPSGRPYFGPSVVSSNPPGDNGSPRLTCHPEGVGTACDRGL